MEKLSFSNLFPETVHFRYFLFALGNKVVLETFYKGIKRFLSGIESFGIFKRYIYSHRFPNQDDSDSIIIVSSFISIIFQFFHHNQSPSWGSAN